LGFLIYLFSDMICYALRGSLKPSAFLTRRSRRPHIHLPTLHKTQCLRCMSNQRYICFLLIFFPNCHKHLFHGDWHCLCCCRHPWFVPLWFVLFWEILHLMKQVTIASLISKISFIKTFVGNVIILIRIFFYYSYLSPSHNACIHPIHTF